MSMIRRPVPAGLSAFILLNPGYLLLVSGDTAEEKPDCRFVHNRNSEQYIDIRTDDLDAFLEENPPLESQS